MYRVEALPHISPTASCLDGATLDIHSPKLKELRVLGF